MIEVTKNSVRVGKYIIKRHDSNNIGLYEEYYKKKIDKDDKTKSTEVLDIKIIGYFTHVYEALGRLINKRFDDFILSGETEKSIKEVLEAVKEIKVDVKELKMKM